MRTILASLALSAAVLAAPAPQAAAADAARLMTIITSPEPQTQMMALVLTMAAVQKGAAARVMLCGPAGDIALTQAPLGATTPQAPRGLSPQGLMVRLMEGGVPVSVCAIYLPNRGTGPEVLLEGIEVAAPPAVADYILGEGVRLLTF